MTFELKIFAAFLSVLCSVILMIIFRRDAVFTFVALWLFLPKLGTNLFGINEIPLFSFVELAASLTLLIIALQARQRARDGGLTSSRSPLGFSVEGGVIAFYALMFILQHCVFSWILCMSPGLHADIPFGKIFSSIVREMGGVIFLFACYKLITTMEQVERILKLFVVVSLVLVAELLAVFFVGPIANIIGAYSMSEIGHFRSVFINDNLMVGLMSGMGALTSLHLYKKEGKWRMIIAFLMTSTVLLYGFYRSTMVAFVLGLGAFFYVAYFRQWSILKRMLCLITIAAAIMIISTDVIDTVAVSAAEVIPSETKSRRIVGYAMTESVFTRFGIQLRALEVIIHIFPLGVGAGMMPYYMGGDAAQIFHVTDPDLYDGYSRVAQNVVITNTHSGYIDQIGSYGVMGLLSLVLLMAIFLRNMNKAMNKGQMPPSLYPLTLGAAIFFGIFYMFTAMPRVYIMFLLIFHLSFLFRNTKNHKTVG